MRFALIRFHAIKFQVFNVEEVKFSREALSYFRISITALEIAGIAFIHYWTAKRLMICG